jgi:hypothetical protein
LDDRFPGFNGGVIFGAVPNIPNGNYIQFFPDTANSELKLMPEQDGRLEQYLRLVPPNRFFPLFSGITFGRYRLLIKDGDNSRYSNWANFYIELGIFDSDGDGISDWTEFDTQNAMDLTHFEARQVRVPNANDRRIVELSTTNGSFFGVSTSDSPPAEPPAGVDFPIGFFQFGVTLPSNESTVVVTITPPPGVQLTSYWKFGREPDDPNTTDDDWKKQPHWYEFTFDEVTRTGAIADEDGGISLYLRDGQRGDDDLQVNGLIFDPGAPALGAPPLPGDYNIDGAIDAADYVVWRKKLGQSVFEYTFADGNGDAIVDEDDYSLWRANFGATLSPATGTITVAEPPAEPGAFGWAAGSASFGETARQPPASPGVDTAAVRAASFAALEIESRRQDWRPSSRGKIARNRFANSTGDELLLLAIDRAQRSRQQDPPSTADRERDEADANDVTVDGISRKQPATLIRTFS